MWAPQLASWPDRGYPDHGYFLIAPDMRGHGQSAKTGGLEIYHWADDLEYILDNLDISSAHVVGVSMGGIIAMEFACRHPSHVRTLVLSDTFGKLKSTREKLVGHMALLGLRVMRCIPAGMRAKSLASAYDFPGGEQAARYFQTIMEKQDMKQLIITRRAINRVDTEERLKNLNIPSLVLVGTKPGEFFIQFSRRLAENLNTAPVLLEGALDPSNLTATRRFDNEVLTFIGRH
jgi:3-oxoadipate enol-lactonase